MIGEAPLTLRHPVCTLDNHVLFPAGTVLSADVLRDLIESQNTVLESEALCRHCFLQSDLLKFLGDPPYHAIFSDEKDVAGLMADMENIHLPLPVLATLDYFRQHCFYTYHHVLMVFALSTLLAKDLIPGSEAEIIHAATGPTHDIGKICVPVDILKKPGPLTMAERDVLEHHTTAGYVLLSHYFKNAKAPATRTAKYHHERRNGQGYPRGMELTDPWVEIVALCDIYDALISPRPYRPAFDNRSALEEVIGMAGRGEISPDAVRALVAYNRTPRADFRECRLSKERRGTSPTKNSHGVLAEEEDE
jgi:HD-GYP domain-containing protein (c-di-GMP phosphodiesterase class II)